MLLSYIIPLYNCERYIGQCLDSIYRQGISTDDFEVIVVNDGSTDNGVEIVMRYCKTFGNIYLINQDNCGVSDARNKGIKKAQGEYLYFMDADDWLVGEGMRVLIDTYLTVDKHPDMIGFCHRIVDKYYDADKWERIVPHQLLFRGTFYKFGMQFGINGFLWTWVISRKLILENNIFFKPYAIAEDWLFMASVFAAREAIVIKTNMNIYRYRIHNESVTNCLNAQHIIKIVNSLFDVFKETRSMEAVSCYKEENFEEYVWYFRRKAFFSICSAPLSIRELRLLLDCAFREGFYPIEYPTKILHKLINYTCYRPVVMFGFSILYRKIFLSYIKPYLKRN